MEGATGEAQTFLVADIRGYSRFTTARGAAAAAQLASTFTGLGRDAIVARNGRVLGLRGDEILAAFSSAGQAVRAALEIQSACEEATAESPEFPLDIGAGLDLGEVVEVDDAYHGAAINMAARLCSQAQAGQVLVTDRIVLAAGGEADLVFLSTVTVELKGFSAPVEMFLASFVRSSGLLWAPGESTPLQPELDDRTPMAGRDEDLSWLRGVWRQARRGRGRVVLVSGPAGVGKTRLAAELAAYVAASGSPVHYSGTGGSGRGEAFAAVTEARAGTRGGLWVVDDLHLYPEAVAGLSEALDSIGSRPVQVVGLYRDSGGDVGLAALADRLVLADGIRVLGPLDLEGVRVVASGYADDLEDLPAESILRASGGSRQPCMSWSTTGPLRRLGGVSWPPPSGWPRGGAGRRQGCVSLTT